MPVSATFVDCLMHDRAQLEQANPASAEDVRSTVRTLAAWMQWALVIDETLERLHGGAYTSRRGSDPGGQAVMGLRYAWERLKHQGHKLDDAVLTHIGPDRPVVHEARYPPRSRVVPAAAWEARWKAFNDLPIPDPRFQEPGPVKPKEDGYRHHLSEQPVIASTSPIQEFLLRCVR